MVTSVGGVGNAYITTMHVRACGCVGAGLFVQQHTHLAKCMKYSESYAPQRKQRTKAKEQRPKRPKNKTETTNSIFILFNKGSCLPNHTDCCVG